MNAIAKQPLSCPYCNRVYKSRHHFKKHTLMCQIINSSTRERALHEEQTQDTPTLRELYDIICELTAKSIRLEREVTKLKASSRYNCKTSDGKLVTLSECMVRHNPKHTFVEWMAASEKKISRQHLEYVFENDYLNGLENILNEIVYPEAPFTISGAARGSFLIWDGMNWNDVIDSQVNNISSMISKYLMNELIAWQQENMHRLHDLQFSTKFSEYVQKAIGEKHSQSYIVLQTKKIISNILKNR